VECEARLSYYGPWNYLGLIASRRMAVLLAARGIFWPVHSKTRVLRCKI